MSPTDTMVKHTPEDVRIWEKFRADFLHYLGPIRTICPDDVIIWEKFRADLLLYLDPIRTICLEDYRMDLHDMLYDSQKHYRDIVRVSRPYKDDSTMFAPCGSRLWACLSLGNKMKLTRIKMKVRNPLWLDLAISSYWEPQKYKYIRPERNCDCKYNPAVNLTNSGGCQYFITLNHFKTTATRTPQLFAFPLGSFRAFSHKKV